MLAAKIAYRAQHGVSVDRRGNSAQIILKRIFDGVLPSSMDKSVNQYARKRSLFVSSWKQRESFLWSHRANADSRSNYFLAFSFGEGQLRFGAVGGFTATYLRAQLNNAQVPK